MQEELIRFFKENSETIARTFEEGMQVAQMKKIEKIGQGLVKNKDKLLNTPITLGNKSGKVRLVVFVDPNCLHCRGFFKEVLPKVLGYNIPELGVSLLSWPMLDGSESIARMMHAVYQQGGDKFQALLAEMGISTQDQSQQPKPLNKDELLSKLASKGVDVQKVKTAQDSDAVKKAVADTKKVSEEMEILGTPFVVLVTDKDVRMVNTLQPEMLKKLVEATIQGKTPEATGQAPA